MGQGCYLHARYLHEANQLWNKGQYGVARASDAEYLCKAGVIFWHKMCNINKDMDKGTPNGKRVYRAF